MTQYMSLFQIGPVQDFIQTARKTQDFWSGSFLLSYLNARAIYSFGQQDVVFPASDAHTAFKAAVHENVPWNRRLDSACYRSSLPNRFFAVTTVLPETQLKKAKIEVTETFCRIADIVWKNLCPGISEVDEYSVQTTWNHQIKIRAFEILFVWREIGLTEPYENAYRNAEIHMRARKATRVFDGLDPQEGHACSLCGLRSALGPEKCSSREQIRQWFEKVIRKNGHIHKFRENESLCAVCVVKRLAPSVVFHIDAVVPSTSCVAAAGFHRDFQEAMQESDIADNIEKNYYRFQDKARKAAQAIEDPKSPVWPSRLYRAERKLHPGVDGDWYFEPFYLHPDRRSRPEVNQAADAWENFAGKCREIGLQPPSRYLALIAGDGDSMGRVLGKIQDKTSHKQLSRLLVDFSIQAIPRVLEEQNIGYVLYWGGDEGVAMVCLEDLLNALNLLREAWRCHVQGSTLFETLGIEAPTFSIGAVIVHHQYPLRSAFREVQETLEAAKEVSSYGREKDAWAIRIVRRSGPPVLTRAHWNYDGFRPLDLLERFFAAYRKNWLSPRWLGDLRAERQALQNHVNGLSMKEREQSWEDSRQLFDNEVPRLIRRHMSTETDAGKDQHIQGLIRDMEKLNDFISESGPAQKNRQRHEHLSAMMDLAHYLAKGGGR